MICRSGSARTWGSAAQVVASVLILVLAGCGGGSGGSSGGGRSGDPDGETPAQPEKFAVGELDRTFGDADPAGSGTGERLGYVVPTPDPGRLASNGVAVATDAQDRIIVAGVIDCLDVTYRAALWRLLPDGTPDPDFSGSGGPCVARDPPSTPGGGTGYVTFAADSFVHGLVVAPDGEVLLAGKINAPGLVGNAVWRFRADGSLDTAFGDPHPSGVRSGYTLIDDADGAAVGLESFGGRNAWLGLALDDSGRILVAGTAEDRPVVTGCWGLLDKYVAVERYTADGVDDTSFGKGDFNATTSPYDGYFRFTRVVTDDAQDLGSGVAVDNEGRILVTGRTPQDSTTRLERMILLRLR